MPRYHAAGVEVRLITYDLEYSTCPHPTANVDADFHASVARADKAVDDATTLSEKDIALRDDNSHVKFLGTSEDVPFFLIKAHPTRPKVSELGPTTTRAVHLTPFVDLARIPLPCPITPPSSFSSPVPRLLKDLSIGPTRPDQTPPSKKLRSSSTRLCADEGFSSSAWDLGPWHKALAIRIDYQPTVIKRLEKLDAMHDLKIEVFYNGALASTAFVPGRHINNPAHVGFLSSGRKTSRLVERAFLLATSANNRASNHYSIYASKAGGQESALARWNKINAAIASEADAFGRVQGARPPVADYLSSLSAVEMPSSLHGIQSPNTLRFGVIDVVVSVGQGAKYSASTGYIWKTERMLDPSHKSVCDYSQDSIAQSNVSAMKRLDQPVSPAGLQRFGRAETTGQTSDVDEGSPRSKKRGAPLHRSSFKVPELCRNSVLSYADEVDGTKPAYGVRQVRAERAGQFKETSVLMGVRFIVDPNENW